jgi:methylase of polypeptide subunit release factors
MPVTWPERGAARTGAWLGPSTPPPGRVGEADDRTTAAAALARVRRGEALVYGGDFRNARQLLAAMGRRLNTEGSTRRGRGGAQSATAAWSAQRALRRDEHELLGRLLVPVEAGLRVPLRNAPDVSAALAEALGPDAPVPGLVPLRDVLGMIGAHEWRRKGVDVPALGARVHPHYGVYAPVRGEYVGLVAEAARRRPLAGKRALDVGTGTGVLAFVLARAGARVVATDVEPAAVACARENAGRLGLADRVEIVQADLFVDGAFDVVVSNPPWLPEAARTPLERAVYDPGGAFLARLLAGLPAHLAPGGEAWLVVGDLAERLGLRPAGEVEAAAARAGLHVAEVLETPAAHPRARDAADPLHALRAAEVTRLYRIVAAG